MIWHWLALLASVAVCIALVMAIVWWSEHHD
jgi:hypothetical protein